MLHRFRRIEFQSGLHETGYAREANMHIYVQGINENEQSRENNEFRPRLLTFAIKSFIFQLINKQCSSPHFVRASVNSNQITMA